MVHGSGGEGGAEGGEGGQSVHGSGGEGGAEGGEGGSVDARSLALLLGAYSRQIGLHALQLLAMRYADESFGHGDQLLLLECRRPPKQLGSGALFLVTSCNSVISSEQVATGHGARAVRVHSTCGGASIDDFHQRTRRNV